MNGNDAAHAATGVGQLNALIGGLEDKLAAWAEATSSWLGTTGKVTGTGIDKFIRPAVAGFMSEENSLLAGAGFVAAAGLLGEERSYIAWWQGADMERVDALANFSPQSTSRYVKAEWFKVPMATGQPHVTGPYIDLLCTDEYVLTFTHPIFRDGEPAGVVGLDVTAQAMERAALGILRQIGPHAVLVNAGGRSVVSASAEVDAGDVATLAQGAADYPVGRQFSICSATA